MERRNKLFVGLLSTLITYSSLMVLVGPKHNFRSGYHDHRQYGWHKHNKCRKEHGAVWDKHRKQDQNKSESNSTQPNQ